MPSNWPIEEWRTSMIAAGRAETTIENRVWALRRFARSNPDPWAVTPRDVEATLAGWGRKPDYKRQVLAGIHTFYRWAIRSGLTIFDPTVALDSIKASRARARPCPERIIAAAVMRADTDTRLMILLMHHCGLRCAETASLHTDAIDGEDLTVRGKGRVTRSLRLSEALQIELAPRCRTRGYIFPGRFDAHLRPASVGVKVKQALDHPGFSAHTLRHRFATTAYRQTGDLLLVSQALGHASVATTQRYIAVDDDGLTRIARAFG